MKALVLQADKTAKVEVVPVPEIADDEILVKTVALAQNPTDWKGRFSTFRRPERSLTAFQVSPEASAQGPSAGVTGLATS